MVKCTPRTNDWVSSIVKPRRGQTTIMSDTMTLKYCRWKLKRDRRAPPLSMKTARQRCSYKMQTVAINIINIWIRIGFIGQECVHKDCFIVSLIFFKKMPEAWKWHDTDWVGRCGHERASGAVMAVMDGPFHFLYALLPNVRDIDWPVFFLYSDIFVAGHCVNKTWPELTWKKKKKVQTS